MRLKTNWESRNGKMEIENIGKGNQFSKVPQHRESLSSE